MNKTEVDITPHPKILSVLGEIEFKPWQCIAELIDNSIDGFLKMARAETPIETPIIQVAFGRDTVTVKDNGPGMAIEALENAVKAGWTSNERFGNLGLYGVGFNIATARLGSVTTIWTTEVGDTAWYGLEIDLQQLAQGEHYKIAIKSRIKSDAKQSGTIVEVTKIKQDWKDLLSNTSWLRSNITDRLSSIYGTMLRDLNPQPIKFTLYVNDKKVSAWEHCVWPAEWMRYRKEEGLVRPIQEIDIIFGEKYLAHSTGEIYDTLEEAFQEGIEEKDIITIPERVYGWIGIQRYADEKEYGIDILRNGRKIEVACKDIFDWEDANGDILHEYPIDDPRQKGRIVGEIHLDHGYVHYTKHRFEREHSSWKQLLKAVRNNEPLTRRKQSSLLGVNESPLGILFRVFRRNSPAKGQKWEDILFIKENDKAKSWAREYRKGNPKYRNDEIWLEELKRSDGNLDADASSNSSSTQQNQPNDFILGSNGYNGSKGSNGISDEISSEENSDVQNNLFPQSGESGDTYTGNENKARSEQDIPNEPLNQRTPIPELNLHVTGMGFSGKSYDVEVFALTQLIPTGIQHLSAWSARLTAKSIYEIDVNLEHPAFNSTSLQVRDAVLAQVAYLITYEENENGTNGQNLVSYGDILVELRKRYATTDSLDANYLQMEINNIRRRLTDCLSKSLNENQQKDLLKHLLEEDTSRIKLSHARGPKNASLISYFEMKHLARLLELQPEIFFEDTVSCINQSWTPPSLAYNIMLLNEHRTRLVRELLMLTKELGQYMDDLISVPEQTRSYLALIRSCVNRLKDYLVV